MLVVLTSLLMWMPRLSGRCPSCASAHGAQMLYLFAQSSCPTVPAGWLTFAEGVVYKAYDRPAAGVGDLGSPTTSSWPG